MQLALDDDEVELLLVLIDLNIRALRISIAGDIGHQERAIHGIRLINLQRIRNRLVALMN